MLFRCSAFGREPFACGSRGEAATDWVSTAGMDWTGLDSLHAAVCWVEVLHVETGRADYICKF